MKGSEDRLVQSQPPRTFASARAAKAWQASKDAEFKRALKEAISPGRAKQ